MVALDSFSLMTYAIINIYGIAHQYGKNVPVITNSYFYDDAGRLTDNIHYDGTQQTDKFTAAQPVEKKEN